MIERFKDMTIKKRNKTAKVPKCVLEELKTSGAVVEKLQGEDLYSVSHIEFKDKAWDIYATWGEAVNQEPRVGAMFAPSETALCPKDILGIPIQRETNSVIHYYAPLRIEDFANNVEPGIGPPLQAHHPHVIVHHSAVALSRLMERIQKPPENYPAIHGLKSGSYICTVIQTWANAVVEITLFKS
jgi:hypothetical protein